MKKKGLFLLAAAIIATGLTSDMYVNAEVIKSSGAIIRQMNPVDYQTELHGILDREVDEYFSETDRPIEVYVLYEQNNMFEQADENFLLLLEDIEKTKKTKEKKEKIQKLEKRLYELTLQEPYNARYFYKYYIFNSVYGTYEEAMKALKKAYSLDKINPEYLSQIAKIYSNENDYDKAIKIYEALKRNYPRELNYRLALGQVYSQAGFYDDAIREYRVAADFDPDNSDALVALNELIPYTIMQQRGGRMFYDPMRAVKQDKIQVENNPVNKVVAFSTVQNQPLATNTIPVNSTTIGTPSQNRQVVNAAGTSSQTSRNLTMAQYQKNAKSKKNVNKVPKTAPGSKRIMVTYVDGRKVVKIVNINSEANSSSTLQDASSTFNNQLDDLNSGYDTTGTTNTSNTMQVQPSSSSQSRYQTLSGSSYIRTSGDSSSDITSSGDPSVQSLSYNTGGHKQLVVTQENGKKKVKTIGSGSSSVSETKNAVKSLKEQEKLRKKEAKEQAKLDKLTKKQKSSLTQNNSAPVSSEQDNADAYIKSKELMVQEDYNGAIAVLQKVNPPTLLSLTTMAACYNSLGKTDTAIEYYKKADKLSPNNAQILYALAYLYYTQNDMTQANKYIDASLKIDPNNQNAVQLKQYMSQNASSQTIDSAVSYMNQGNYPAAKKILEKVIIDHPNDFQAHYYLGHICYATQKYEDATKHFLTSIKINPDYALSYYSIGLAYDKLKEFNKSIAAYQQFLQMETDDNRYTQYAQTRINTIKSKQ
ncbi:MAG: tetratricopeptide repeat protein [Candidatus Gastranaerophilales bacterium]|nr:tetratricopeptide repeat protein [Candidatus Gastranaerophilales bacterium]